MINNQLDIIHQHVDFLVRTRQFDELTEIKDFVCERVTDLINHYLARDENRD